MREPEKLALASKRNAGTGVSSLIHYVCLSADRFTTKECRHRSQVTKFATLIKYLRPVKSNFILLFTAFASMWSAKHQLRLAVPARRDVLNSKLFEFRTSKERWYRAPIVIGLFVNHIDGLWLFLLSDGYTRFLTCDDGLILHH